MKLAVLGYFLGMVGLPKCVQAHIRACDEFPRDCLLCGLIIAAIERRVERSA